MAIRRSSSRRYRRSSGAAWKQERVISDGVAYEVTQVLEQISCTAQARPRRRGASAGPPPARPAPPTTTPTPGSRASRRSPPPPCGSVTRAGEIPMLNIHGIAVAGSTFPAEIWGRFPGRALAAAPREFGSRRSGRRPRGLEHADYRRSDSYSYDDGQVRRPERPRRLTDARASPGGRRRRGDPPCSSSPDAPPGRTTPRASFRRDAFAGHPEGVGLGHGSSSSVSRWRWSRTRRRCS